MIHQTPYSRHDSSEPRVDPRTIPSSFIVRIPRLAPRERMLMVSWATPVSHMNIVRVRRGVAESLAKIASAVLMLSVLYVGIGGTGGTISYFADTELSTANLLVADPLGFTLSIVESSQVDMSAGTAYVIPVMTPNADSEPIQYSVTGHMTGGDGALCAGLTVLATTSVSYAGPLYTFTTDMSTSTGEVPILFTLENAGDVARNSSCTIELAFRGRNADAPQGRGYTDEKILTLQFYIPAPIEVASFVTSTGELPPASSPDVMVATDTPPTTQVPPETANTTSLSDQSPSTPEIVLPDTQAVGQGSTVSIPEIPPPVPDVITAPISELLPTTDPEIPPLETPPLPDPAPAAEISA